MNSTLHPIRTADSSATACRTPLPPEGNHGISSGLSMAHGIQRVTPPDYYLITDSSTVTTSQLAWFFVALGIGVLTVVLFILLIAVATFTSATPVSSSPFVS